MEYSQILELIIVISLVNCGFVTLGFFAGKAFRIIEISENESMRIQEGGYEETIKIPMPEGNVKNNKKNLGNFNLYPDEDAYVVTRADEEKMQGYLKGIQNGTT